MEEIYCEEISQEEYDKIVQRRKELENKRQAIYKEMETIEQINVCENCKKKFKGSFNWSRLCKNCEDVAVRRITLHQPTRLETEEFDRNRNDTSDWQRFNFDVMSGNGEEYPQVSDAISIESEDGNYHLHLECIAGKISIQTRGVLVCNELLKPHQEINRFVLKKG